MASLPMPQDIIRASKYCPLKVSFGYWDLDQNIWSLVGMGGQRDLLGWRKWRLIVDQQRGNKEMVFNGKVRFKLPSNSQQCFG